MKKSIIKILGLLLLFSIFNTNVSANQIIYSTEIPEQMQPNTIIEYVDSTHYCILEGGIYSGDKRELESVELDALQEAGLNEDVFENYSPYPSPQEGMKIIYGTNGHLVEIEYPENYVPNYDTLSVTNSTYSLINPTDGQLRMLHMWGGFPNILYEITGTNYVYGTGQATTYDHYIGQADIILSKGSVAIDQRYDSCAVGTPVYVVARMANSTQTKGVWMTKHDVGDLLNGIVDIWRDGVTYWGYSVSIVANELSLEGTATIRHLR